MYESEFRFDECKEYLLDMEVPLVVRVSEDSKSRIELDRQLAKSLCGFRGTI